MEPEEVIPDYPTYRSYDEVNRAERLIAVGIHGSDVSIPRLIQDQVAAIPRKLANIQKLEQELQTLRDEVDLLRRLEKTIIGWEADRFTVPEQVIDR